MSKILSRTWVNFLQRLRELKNPKKRRNREDTMAPTGELFMQHFEKVIQNRIKYKLLDDNTQRQRMIILDDIDYYGEGIPDYLRQAKDIELGILTKVTNKKDRTPKLYVVAMPKGSWKDIDSTKSKVLRGLDEFGN